MKKLLVLFLLIPSLNHADIISLGCECQMLETSILSPDGMKKENKKCNKFIDINIDFDNQTVFTQSSFFTHFEKGNRFDYYEDGYDIRFEQGKNFKFQKDKIHTGEKPYPCKYCISCCVQCEKIQGISGYMIEISQKWNNLQV